ncbi:hypothetical protein NB709_000925 [Xanthomonas sacchari]|uniref:hypothetical protein n=1 Tax=Xanthomonas sacchari TaxID=56458 RepID=UPI00224E178E|nr:hypothetical protein [Xanthomonas sacchari]MCW0411049.1 hypothetical protein [Xanthomonas sacchari]
MMKRLHFFCLLSLVAVLGCGVFVPGLSGGFLFDDYQAVVENGSIMLKAITLHGLWEAAHAYGGPIGRPIATLSLALGYWMHGMDPGAYKEGNLLLHAFNIVLVGILLRRLFALAWPAESDRNQAIASILVSLAWGVHPLQVSSVLYVVQRMELLGNFFLLLSLIAYVSARTRQMAGVRGGTMLVLSFVFLVLGVLSKENATQMPVYAFVIELALMRFSAQNRRLQKVIKVAYGSIFAVGAVVFFGFLLPHISGQFAMRDFTMWERVMTQFRVLPEYMYWMVWPSPGNLTFYHDDVAPSHGMFQPITTFLGLVFLGGFVSIGILARRKAPLVSLGVGFFFASHLITSAPLALELVFEHRNYLALLGPLLIAAELVRWLVSIRMHAVAFVLVGACIAGLAFATFLRSSVWGNPALFANSAVIDNKNSSRASYELASIYMERSGGEVDSINYTLAMAELARASILPRSSPLPEQAMILINAKAGRPVNPEWQARIVRKFEARPLGPQEFSAFYALHSERMDGTPVSDQLLKTISEIYVRRQPELLDAHLLYADYAGRILRDPGLAAREYCAAIQIKHDSAYDERLVASLVEQGRIEEARLVAPCIARKNGALVKR